MVVGQPACGGGYLHKCAPVVQRSSLLLHGLQPRGSVDVAHGRHLVLNPSLGGRRDGHEGRPIRRQPLEPLVGLLGEHARRERTKVLPVYVLLLLLLVVVVVVVVMMVVVVVLLLWYFSHEKLMKHLHVTNPAPCAHKVIVLQR